MPARNEDYLNYIRKMPCMICRGQTDDPLEMDHQSEAAHVRIGGDGGMGLKPSDYRSVPLCHIHHRSQHVSGERTFWRDVAGRDPNTVIAGLIIGYLKDPRAAISALEALAEAERGSV